MSDSHESQNLIWLEAWFQIEDARAAMVLYQKNIKEWEKLIKDQIRLKQKQKKRKQKKKTKQGDDIWMLIAAQITNHQTSLLRIRVQQIL